MNTRSEDLVTRLTRELADPDPEALDRSIRRMQLLLGDLSEEDYHRAVEALCSLFYIDTSDHPVLETPLARATEVLAEQGPRVVPLLIRQMESSDLKSHLYLARVLGRIGCDAIKPLRDLLATAEDPYSRAFALYALGKMSCPEIPQALPEVIGGLMHPDKEVRDSAARTLGKIAEAAPADTLTARRRREMFEGLLRAARDPEPPVRAKALRSLGKMGRARLLSSAQIERVTDLARSALGENGSTWDNAFIVRREAREILLDESSLVAARDV
ncbi:MAG: HEAT repeat domain-containing protein [Acidobacteriota bacterium]